MRVAKDLNPEALRRPQAKNKVCTDKEFVEAADQRDAKPSRHHRQPPGRELGD